MFSTNNVIRHRTFYCAVISYKDCIKRKLNIYSPMSGNKQSKLHVMNHALVYKYTVRCCFSVGIEENATLIQVTR